MADGKVIGYGRVSSTDQNLEVQTDKLKAAGCTKLFLEKKSGKSTEGRHQLAAALDFVREGDTFVVTRFDRLARSTVDLLSVLEALEEKGVEFKCTDQKIDTSGPMGKFFLTIMGAVAEFELGIRKERQLDGIAKAKAAGVYKGRKRTVNAAEVAKLVDEGVGPTEIAKRLKIGRASVYRALEAA
jgi:DNA invertase Pin-like site-specific DNA recombinase